MLVGIFLIGLVGLVLGADLLVRGASRLAALMSVSPLLVGLTIVALGTSAPEIAVSLKSSLEGLSDIAVGNVVGSNILNILLVLGFSALITPLTVHRQVVKQEIPILVGVSLLLVLFAQDGGLSKSESLFLVLGSLLYFAYLINDSRQKKKEVPTEPINTTGTLKVWITNLGFIILGLVLLVYGSQLLVDAAVQVSQQFGWSQSLVGLTIVAIGTSLPEIATSLMAAVKGEKDLAVGNVIGSNILNILVCLGVAGIFSKQGLMIQPALVKADLWLMLAAAALLLPLATTERPLFRLEAILFIFFYTCYLIYLVAQDQAFSWAQDFNQIMIAWVLPLIISILLFALVKRAQKNI